MPAISFGLKSYTTGDFLDEVSISRDTELAKRRGTSGNFTASKAFNPTNDLNIKGGGSSGLAIGLVAPSVSGLSGGVMYNTKDETTEHNSDFNDFQSTVNHLPNSGDVNS